MFSIQNFTSYSGHSDNYRLKLSLKPLIQMVDQYCQKYSEKAVAQPKSSELANLQICLNLVFGIINSSHYFEEQGPEFNDRVDELSTKYLSLLQNWVESYETKG